MPLSKLAQKEDEKTSEQFLTIIAFLILAIDTSAQSSKLSHFSLKPNLPFKIYFKGRIGQRRKNHKMTEKVQP